MCMYVCRYQFSLAAFLKLFKRTLNTKVAGGSSKDTKDRLLILSSSLEITTLDFVGKGLFKADRLMFALHLVKRMHATQFQAKEWEVCTTVISIYLSILYTYTTILKHFMHTVCCILYRYSPAC